MTEVARERPGGVLAHRRGRRRPDRRRARAVGADRRHRRCTRRERRTHRFAPATLQALVEPEDPTQRTALFAGLAELADEDPLIDLRLDEDDGEAAVSLHGEVQKEVIAALLRGAVRRARPLPRAPPWSASSGSSGPALRRSTGSRSRGNPYLAGIGLRVEAAPVGHGVEFSPGIERGNLPPAFVAATEEGVRAALRQGLHGWAVTDCVVTMTESQYCPRQSRPHQKFDKSISSVAADFRHLAPVVLTAALAPGRHPRLPAGRPVRARPARRGATAPVAALLGRLGARPRSRRRPAGLHPARRPPAVGAVPDVAARLPDLTSGEGVLVTRLDHHAPVTDAPPSGAGTAPTRATGAPGSATSRGDRDLRRSRRLR